MSDMENYKYGPVAMKAIWPAEISEAHVLK